MALLLLGLVFLLSMAAQSNEATYCICKDGLSDSVLQKDIDYACGAGADCSAISQGGSCFNPNTVKDHCNYAVNSYFQKKGQAPGTCDFSGTATPSANPPALATNGCVFPSSGSGGTPTTPGTGTPGTGVPGTGTPSTGTPGTGTPGTGTPGTATPGTGTPGTGTPGTGTPGTGTPGTGTPGTGTPGMGTPSTGTPGTGTPGFGNPGTGTPSTTVPGTSPFPGLAPQGGISNPDGSGTASLRQCTHLFYSLTSTLLFSVLFCFKL
ncbi:PLASMODESMATA CALLOSE-BINDING PROTEIN 3 [Heracleum sosnowskyi]|uniref:PLASMODESMATA CALLOSE-BINDING PROTEIN 3 n=1 Tax=Heracleum sosnowskyi TaxID=360622 RepID=A0AAD8H6B0_9APIA|nr:PLASMODESMATA CALLOSE-BINDING PROTEIN 3 [Heracleum sosnowskyi]